MVEATHQKSMLNIMILQRINNEWKALCKIDSQEPVDKQTIRFCPEYGSGSKWLTSFDYSL